MPTTTRQSRWTSIYWGVPPGGAELVPYIRLVPDFLDLEPTRFPHGLPLGHGPCENERQANQLADRYDAFFDAMLAEAQEELLEGLVERADTATGLASLLEAAFLAGFNHSCEGMNSERCSDLELENIRCAARRHARNGVIQLESSPHASTKTPTC